MGKCKIYSSPVKRMTLFLFLQPGQFVMPLQKNQSIGVLAFLLRREPSTLITT